jgi:dipeptidyl aminopeptidase/acylaminoacyl peptidase
MIRTKKGRALCLATACLALVVSSGVSEAARIPPRRIVEVVDLSTPAISPDGRLVAFRAERASVDRNNYDSVWYVQAMDGSAPPHRVGMGGVPLRDSAGGSIPETAVWSPDGKYIFYRALLDGRVDVWRAATDGSGAEPVTLDPADVREFSLVDDGGTLKYAVGATRDEVLRAEQSEYDAGIHIDETVPVGANLFRSSYVTGRLATQRYIGIWFARGSLLDDAPDSWREIDLETGERRVLPPGDAAPEKDARKTDPSLLPVTVFQATDSRTGRTAVLTRADGGDRAKRSNVTELAILPAEPGAKTIPCEAEQCIGKSISSVQWRPGGHELLFTITDREQGEAQSIFRWNVATGEVRPVVVADGFINGGRIASTTCGISGKALACIAAEAASPPRLEAVDIATGQRRVLFEPNAALGEDLEETILSRLVSWRGEGGKKFSGQLFVGRVGAGEPRPLFVNYYRCGGFLRGGMGDEWPLASMAEAGISTLCISSPPSPKDPVVRYDTALDAVRSAIDLLAAEGLVDRGRVGMGGLSFGSEVTLWVAMNSDLLSAASVTTPSGTPTYYLMNQAKGEMFRAGLRQVWGLGSPEETPERWKLLSPAYNVDRIRIPVLFQMPEEEYLYALDYIFPLMQRKRADLYVFPDEPHRKFQPRHMLSAYERNLDWFRFWLQGVEDDDPGKAAQYARWRGMRSVEEAARPDAEISVQP